MDRLISEQAVFKTIDNLKANFTCYDSVTLDEVYSHVKAISPAEPYKGMTNGEVMHKLFPNTPFVIGDIGISVKWWNSSYEPQERSDKE